MIYYVDVHGFLLYPLPCRFWYLNVSPAPAMGNTFLVGEGTAGAFAQSNKA
ncbi:hypothetical protein Cst04h_11770 [Corynebacterium striatum]|uniref:Uncharacterized protein n=1 Tax=Corynebacterium striatum TaxID=43770 RepID=A0ABC9ZLH7_CORST|nr:hypothetical protein HMPREF0308_1632 [Corynebacterium striatum ATCC 6940]GEA43007.1 hypothetical protein Cst04h_11770 [Corynebacterium striatum]